MNNSEKLGIAGLTIGGIAMGYSIYSHRRVNKIYDLLDGAVDDMSNKIME